MNSVRDRAAAERSEVARGELAVDQLDAAVRVRAHQAESATFEASRSSLNIDSPKNTRPSCTP
jgi:hypothetical protein